MNQRIRELMNQAMESTGVEGLGGSYMELNPEKFAKLVVSDCAQYVEDKFDFCGDEIIIAEKLIEHFGVE